MQNTISNRMRFGFNVNGASLGDEAYFLSTIEKIKPTTVLIMDNMGLALKVSALLGDQTQVIHRRYESGDGEYWVKRSPRQVADMLMTDNNGSSHKNIWKQVMNEPMARGADWKKLADWCAEVGRIMSDNGHKAVLGNLAVGTYELSDVQGGYFDNLIKVVGERKDNVSIGIHEYTGFLLPFGIGLWDRWSLRDPAFVQQSNWPDPAKIPEFRKEYGKQYYHLMRSTWFQVRANEIGAPHHQIHLTEFGWDRLPDLTYGQNHIYASLENKFGVPSGYTEMRGAYTYGNLWKAYYPQWSTAQSILEQFKWADSVYPDWYSGFMPFMWSFNGEWERVGFNFGADRELHNMMIDWAKELNGTISQPTVPQPPVNVVSSNQTAKVDLLEYFRGDGRIYDVSYNFPSGPGTGIERMQTQVENANSRRFFHVKGGPNSAVYNWEELWYDENFIWRGADTSEEKYLYVTEMVDNGVTVRGHKWIPRYAAVGDSCHIICTTSFKHAANGNNDQSRQPYTFNGWLTVNRIYDQYTFQSGITLNNVVELWGYLDDNNRPSLNFERYWYAKGYGLVAWSDPTKNWHSYITDIKPVNSVEMKREEFSWIKLPELPVTTVIPPTTTPDVGVSLTDTRWQDVFVSSTAASSNVRQSAATISPKVAVITKDVPAMILLEAKLQKIDGVWYPIRLNVVPNATHSNGDFSNLGWVRADVFTFKVVDPEPEPPPPEDYNTIAISVRYLVTDAKQKALTETLKSLTKAISLSGAVVAFEEND